VATTDMGRHAPGRPGPDAVSLVPRGRARLALIAISVVVLAETLRFALVSFGAFGADAGAGAATAAVLACCLAGLLAPLIRTLAGPRALLVVGVGGLLAVRLVAQAAPPQLWLAFAGTALAMIAVVALYEAARGLSGVGFATAAVAGLAVDSALRLGFGTWDPVWRSGAMPWAVCLLLVGAGVTMLVIELRSGPVEPPGITWRDALGSAAFGSFLTLEILVLSSPGFAAAVGWMSPPAAGALVLVGQALTLAFLSSGLAVRAVPGGTAVLGGTVLGLAMGAVTGPYGLTGRAVAWLVLVAGQLLAAWLFAVASRAPLRRAGQGGPVWRVDLGAALGAFLAGALLLPYQLAYDLPLPFPSKILPGLAGVLLGLLAALAAARGGPLPARSTRRALGAGAAALSLLAVPLIVFVTEPAVARPAGAAGSFQLVSYDVRDATREDGRLDLESAARLIAGARADVVLLQNVGRGRPASGTTDTPGWLARRLAMHLIWGPGADSQTGNAVLSRLPIRSSGIGRLPQAGGVRVPGYVWARVEVGGGRSVDVWSTRLAEESIRTREIQAARLLTVWGGAPRTLIAGSVGSESGDVLAQLSDGTGLRHASSAADTSDGWILGTDDLFLTDSGIGANAGASGAPGRQPLAATVRVAE
jgi:hypothetical protein